MSPITVAITGGSGSGKSTFVARLREFFPDSALLCADDYYLPLDDKPPEQRAKVNFDAPEAMDLDLFYADLCALRCGQTIECPVYDYTLHTRSPHTRTVHSAPVLFVEGLHALYEKRLREQYDLLIYLDVPESERLERRLSRDIRLRGRDERSVREQFSATVVPMHERYVAPCKEYAHLVFTGGGQNREAIRRAADTIRELQARKQLCPSG